MTQSTREQLGLSQEDLAGYLGISLHMLESVELGRRYLPRASEQTAVDLINAVINRQRTPPVNHTPAPPADYQIQLVNRLYRKCTIKLNRRISKLEKLQTSYANACFHLDVYQRLAEHLTGTLNQDALARLKWLEWKIGESKQGIINNNAAEQAIVIAEIAGLKSTILALEESLLVRPGASLKKIPARGSG
jgi:transcriptional regulator with XRE-family HTH domain